MYVIIKELETMRIWQYCVSISQNTTISVYKFSQVVKFLNVNQVRIDCCLVYLLLHTVLFDSVLFFGSPIYRNLRYHIGSLWPNNPKLQICSELLAGLCRCNNTCNDY